MAKAKSDENRVTGNFRFEKDSKRFHRFQIETSEGVVGTVYVPKGMDMPKVLELHYKGMNDE